MTGRQLIQMMLGSGMDLDRALVFSCPETVSVGVPTHDPDIDNLTSAVKWDNHYAVSSPVDWTHPEEGDQYYRLVLK